MASTLHFESSQQAKAQPASYNHNLDICIITAVCCCCATLISYVWSAVTMPHQLLVTNLQMSSGLHSVALTLLELGIAWPDYSDTTDISLGLSQAAGGSPIPASDPLPRSAHHFVYVTSSFVRDHHASAQKRGARLQLSTWDFAANISVRSCLHCFLVSSPCFSLRCSLSLPVLSVATPSSLRAALQQCRDAPSVRHTDFRDPADADIPLDVCLLHSSCPSIYSVCSGCFLN